MLAVNVGNLLMAVPVPHDTIQDLLTDQIGICTACLSLTDPIPLEGVAYQCSACQEPCVIGLHVALRLGVVVMGGDEVAT